MVFMLQNFKSSPQNFELDKDFWIFSNCNLQKVKINGKK